MAYYVISYREGQDSKPSAQLITAPDDETAKVTAAKANKEGSYNGFRKRVILDVTRMPS